MPISSLYLQIHISKPTSLCSTEGYKLDSHPDHIFSDYHSSMSTSSRFLQQIVYTGGSICGHYRPPKVLSISCFMLCIFKDDMSTVKLSRSSEWGNRSRSWSGVLNPVKLRSCGGNTVCFPSLVALWGVAELTELVVEWFGHGGWFGTNISWLAVIGWIWIQMGFDWLLVHSAESGKQLSSPKQWLQCSPTFYTMSMSFLNPLLSLHSL